MVLHPGGVQTAARKWSSSTASTSGVTPLSPLGLLSLIHQHGASGGELLRFGCSLTLSLHDAQGGGDDT